MLFDRFDAIWFGVPPSAILFNPLRSQSPVAVGEAGMATVVVVAAAAVAVVGTSLAPEVRSNDQRPRDAAGPASADEGKFHNHTCGIFKNFIITLIIGTYVNYGPLGRSTFPEFFALK